MTQHNQVPGLYLFPDFFTPENCQTILNGSLALYEQLNVADSAEATNADIPQPDFVKSENHNLSSEEKFIRVQLKDSQGKALNSEYFPTYGEEGHVLAYFRGNENLPNFIHTQLLNIQTLIDSNDIIDRATKNSWRLTMNFYKNIGGTVSGFPFHVDIPANGVITMIMNIHQEATFQITNGQEIIDVHIPVGALLILSGESRYKWKHRVLPSDSKSDTANSVERVSLVLGIK